MISGTVIFWHTLPMPLVYELQYAIRHHGHIIPSGMHSHPWLLVYNTVSYNVNKWMCYNLMTITFCSHDVSEVLDGVINYGLEAGCTRI